MPNPRIFHGIVETVNADYVRVVHFTVKHEEKRETMIETPSFWVYIYKSSVLDIWISIDDNGFLVHLMF